MVNILKIEWMKLKNYRVFHVFSILYLLGICLVVWIFFSIYRDLNAGLSEATGNRSDDFFSIFSEGNLWKTVAHFTSYLIYFPVLVYILLITNEVSFKTHRQNIIDGWRRSDFILGKIFVAVALSIITALFTILAVAVMCLLTNLPFEFNFIVVGKTFLMALTYYLFALMLAILLRKSGVAILVFLIYGLLVDLVLALILNNQVYSGLGNFLPLQSADALVAFPKSESTFHPNLNITVAALTCLGYCGLYCFVAVRKYIQDDL
jgi:ABC-2 type transport system permease protein